MSTIRSQAADAQPILLTLAENLELENQALLRSDAAILEAVDHGDRLTEMRGRLSDAIASGRTIDLSLPVRLGPRDPHRPLRRAVRVEPGIRIAWHGDARRPTTPRGRCCRDRTSPFALTFAVRRATGERWLNVAVLPPGCLR